MALIQSQVFLYFNQVLVVYIIIFLFIVSQGYESVPERMVTNQAKANLAQSPCDQNYLISFYYFPKSQSPKQAPLQIKIPEILIEKPLQSPLTPSTFKTLEMQSKSPLNYLFYLDWPMSTLIIVLAKSRGQTNKLDKTPAVPPLATNFAASNNQFQLLLLFLTQKILAVCSLNPKLRAQVGKYLATLMKFPLQRAKTPSFFKTQERHQRPPVVC
ncbi:hypothetical protein PPERSA_09107 [Pseudocohnilembus persalinus]|uniref:Uncharacterized protein n=1 Tax=Pseudocohnilembus persalinus TaxID=266149 RepID=A0A0V0QX14_PSEPJ|nr:hypothetical protein PPERSA_09107 [Pseudocohnilembus persalinus]|eukprot:KRX06705.1 hypothetical protein PPERSA_09107 [Pseudocohnilembus persalinus]